MKKKNETNSHLFPKLNESLTVEQINKHARDKASAEERQYMDYLKRLNEQNKRFRTGGKQI